MKYHEPVMMQEVLEYLHVIPNGKYIDATLGDAGHTIEILKLGGQVLGFDVDDKALERATQRIKAEGLEKNFKAVLGNFKNINNLAVEHGFNEVNGILFDLGYSSSQLADDETGLSFLKDQPLDMRLDANLGVSAADLINALSEKDLDKMFWELSGENLSRKYAKSIVERRALKKFQTTKDLADFLASVASPGYEHGRIHPATRVFQALRIVVNAEMENLEVSLPRAAQLLLPGGRMIVISFHSLEDRVAKKFGHTARLSEVGTPTKSAALFEVVKKPLVPSETEIDLNVRSRSAKMRVFEHPAE